MSQSVRRFGAVWFLVLFFIAGIFAQLPTSGDVMRDRIKKAKGLVAVKNYNAAIYELEGIRKETKEAAVNSVAQVMLMNCYLEQSDYKRAQALLTETFSAKKTNRLGGENYYAVAGQVVKGAKVQLDRYKSLGLMVSDANLPPDAVADINRMRETVELVITQSKTLGANTKETANAMALLEEATGARGNLARDDYDAKRWKDEVADARDGIMNSRGVVDATGDGTLMNAATTANIPTAASNPMQTLSNSVTPIAGKTSVAANPNSGSQILNTQTVTANQSPDKSQNANSNDTPAAPNQPAVNQNQTPQNQDTNAAAANSPRTPSRARKVENGDAPQTPDTAPNASTTANNTVAANSPLSVGSLIEYATAKVNPTYPLAAKTLRTVGTVRVELVVDEQGKPEIQNASGPGMLKQAAQDAVKRWKFKPFMRDGQPVKATGYVSFNFNL